MTELLVRMVPHPGGPAGMHDVTLFTVGADGPVDPPLTEGVLTYDANLGALAALLPDTATAPMQLDPAGLLLFQALPEAVRNALLAHTQQPDPSRIYLEISDQNLQRLPWEILVWHTPAFAGNLEIRVRACHHIVRLWNPDWKRAPRYGQGPLRLLIAVGSRADGVQDDPEIEGIRKGVQPHERIIDIDVVRPLSQRELYDKIKQFRPHILHFIGHGDGGRLIFEAPPVAGQPSLWDWKVSDIATHVGGDVLARWTPELAFLNACRSGAGSNLAPVCAAFLRRGTPAAVGMQGNIQGTAAGILAGKFFQELAAGRAIDEALSTARSEVDVHDQNRFDGAYPALVMSCRPEVALSQFQSLSADYRDRMQRCVILSKLNWFVNQRVPRREICASLWPYLTSETRKPLIVLRGPERHGQTMLSGWLLDLANRHGHITRYVRLSDCPEAVDFVGVLELIWGHPPKPGQSPLFDGLPADSALAERLAAAKAQKDIAIYNDFRQALLRLTSDRPLTIVLDEFRKMMDPGSFWALWEHFFTYLGDRELKHVNVVLSLNDEEHRYYQVDEELKKRGHLRMAKEVTLRPIPKDEFSSLWTFYAHFRADVFRTPEAALVLKVVPQIMLSDQTINALPIAEFETRARHAAGLMGRQLPAD